MEKSILASDAMASSPPPLSPSKDSRKTLLAAIVIFIIVVAAVVGAYFITRSGSTPSNNNPSPSPDATAMRAIVRNTDNAEEENALSAAENANYTDIFKVERFIGYTNSSDYSRYTWANFIDAEVINYYDNRFESLKGKPEYMQFSYEANVYAWNQIDVVYVPEPDSIRVLSLNGTVLFENANYTIPGSGMRFAYRNDTGYQEIQAGEINFSFSKSYVAEMKLGYSETYGSLAAFWSDVYQIIIMDEHFEPLLLCVQSQRVIS